jgi:hypothetical protein
VFLASLPLALFGGETLSGFAWVMLFGIFIGTVVIDHHRGTDSAVAGRAPVAPRRGDAAGPGKNRPRHGRLNVYRRSGAA